MRLHLAVLCAALVALMANLYPVGVLAQPMAAKGAATPIAQIQEWFARYDGIRRKSQMNPAERQQADSLLSKGLAIIMPGADKTESAALFQLLESRNGAAAEEMKQLPVYPETEKLHRGYYQYFADAHSLFSDYLRVQNNIMTPDPKTGKPLMGALLARKQALEELDVANKSLDEQLRAKFNIAPYRYQ